MRPICTNQGFTGEMMGAPCHECGHTNLVHPGYHNPAVAQCVMCLLEATLQLVHDESAGRPASASSMPGRPVT